MGAFSGRPLIVLELFFTGVSHNEAANQSSFSWRLQARETASQPSYGLDLTRTANVSLGLEGGVGLASTDYTFSTNIPWNYDFRPTGLQTRVIRDGSFTVNHRSDGYGGTVYLNSAASDTSGGNLGTAIASAQAGPLPDYNRGPVWIDADASGSVLRGDFFSNSVSATNTSSYSLLEGGFGSSGLGLSGGTVSGTATTVGSYSFRLRANGSFEGSTDTGWQTITVNPRSPVFSDGSVNSSARVGIAYSDGVSASETSSYSVIAAPNNLPPGLSLNTSNGAITGTPTTPGSYSFRIRASNVTGSTDTAIQTITVISAARVWNGTAFVSGLANVWNGSAFVTGTIRVWDGSTWRNTN
jgi:hypothetical protein